MAFQFKEHFTGNNELNYIITIATDVFDVTTNARGNISQRELAHAMRTKTIIVE